jgi:hypothetical protein
MRENVAVASLLVKLGIITLKSESVEVSAQSAAHPEHMRRAWCHAEMSSHKKSAVDGGVRLKAAETDNRGAAFH